MIPLGHDMQWRVWGKKIPALVVLCESLPQDAEEALSMAYDFDAGRHFWESEEDKADREMCIRLCLWQALVARGYVKPYTCPVCGGRYSKLTRDKHEERMRRAGEIGHRPEYEDFGPSWEERFLFIDPRNTLNTWGVKRYERVEHRLMKSLPPGAKAVIRELTTGIPEMAPTSVQKDPYLTALAEGQKIISALDMQIAWEDHKKKVQHARLLSILEIVKGLEREYGTAKKAEILALALKNGIPEPEAEKAIEKLKLDGYLFEPKWEVYKSA